MSDTDRRSFLQQTGAWGTVGAFALSQNTGAAESANDQIRLACIGCGGRAQELLKSFAGMSGVKVVTLCDVDDSKFANSIKSVEEAGGGTPLVEKDIRRVLDDKAVDGVVVATPDHWHAPASILALDAGKHVYVEKPCGHNIREGRLTLDAARRNKKIVQVGTQSRSSPTIIRAMELLREGAIGEILVGKAWNSQLRRSIGRGKTEAVPAGLDYDAWVGPAKYLEFQPNYVRYGWHWFYNFGTGDAGNDGVHDLDIARWGLGMNRHPNSVTATGGKYFYDDDQEFPDTQYVSFEYLDKQGKHPKQLIYEHRIWSPYVQEGFENGNAWYGTKGMLLLGKLVGWKLYGPRNKLVDSMDAGGMGLPHYQNFIDCVRSGKLPNADIEIGHYSAALSHLANIATRLKTTLTFDPDGEKFVGHEEANQFVSREYRADHWAVPKGV